MASEEELLVVFWDEGFYDRNDLFVKNEKGVKVGVDIGWVFVWK